MVALPRKTKRLGHPDATLRLGVYTKYLHSSIPLSGNELNRLRMLPRLITDLLNGPQLEKFHLGLLNFQHLDLRSFESMIMTAVHLIAMEEFVPLNDKNYAAVTKRAPSHGASPIIGSDSTFA